MSYKLWLDDILEPPDPTWIRVKNYNDFTDKIENEGVPNEISFDYDLGEDMAIILHENGMSKRKAKAMKCGVKNGLECVKFLTEHCRINNIKLPICHIHTFNPVGRCNIHCLIENYKLNENTGFD